MAPEIVILRDSLLAIDQGKESKIMKHLGYFGPIMALGIPPADFDPEKLLFVRLIPLIKGMIALLSLFLSTYPLDRRMYLIIFNIPHVQKPGT